MDTGTWFWTGLGGLAWGLLVLGPLPPEESAGLVRPLLFALLVLAPPALALARPSGEKQSPLFRTARYMQPFAALITAGAYLIEPGVLAGTLAIAWLPTTALLAVDSLRRIRRRRPALLEELCADLGLLYLPIGAVFLWVSRLGPGASPETNGSALLAAVLFHFSGFSACILASLAGRALREAHASLGGLFALSALDILAGPILLAAAPLFSPGRLPAFELAVAFGELGLALVLLTSAARSIPAGLPRLFLRASGLVWAAAGLVRFGMGLGGALRAFQIDYPGMISTWTWLVGAGTILGLLAGALVQSAGIKTTT